MSAFDLVIRGGTVADGNGGPPRTADVGITGGIVTDVGPGLGRGRREVSADGALVTPGFVDIHTHYDGQASWDDRLIPSSWHGVTTVDIAAQVPHAAVRVHVMGDRALAGEAATTDDPGLPRGARDTARAVGLRDRGVLAPGYRADVNVIEMGRLGLRRPEMYFDLPGGGRRLLQRAEGYLHTFVRGQETYADGQPTDALPGGLIRGAQPAPSPS